MTKNKWQLNATEMVAKANKLDCSCSSDIIVEHRY